MKENRELLDMKDAAGIYIESYFRKYDKSIPIDFIHMTRDTFIDALHKTLAKIIEQMTSDTLKKIREMRK